MANSWKKKRDKYYKEKLRQYKAISDKYGLGLKWEEYQPIAWEYADKKAQSERGWLSSLFSGGNIFKSLLGIIVSVITIAFSWGATTPLALSILATTASVVAGAYALYSIHLSDKMLGLSIVANMIASKTASLKNQAKAEAQKDKLTHSIIYNAYAIYPNGDIFKANAPGSESYSPSIAYDTSKGLLGTYTSDSIDERVNNRHQVDLSGNNSYIQTALNLEIPLKQFELGIEAKHDVTENQMQRANSRIAEGFTKLNELYFNILGTAERIYKRVFKEQIVPIQKRMVQDDFLDKMRKYSLGLRADFNYLNLYHFNNIPKTQKEIEEELKKLHSVYENIQNSKDYTLEEKAWNYFASISGLLEVLLGYGEVEIFEFGGCFANFIKEPQAQFWRDRERVRELYLMLKEKIASLKQEFISAKTYTLASICVKEYNAIFESKEYKELLNKAQSDSISFEPSRQSGLQQISYSYTTIPLYALSVFYVPYKKPIGMQTQKGVPFNKFYKDYATLPPSEQVLLYEARIKEHFVESNGKFYFLCLDKPQARYAFLPLSAESYKILSQNLPKSKELLNFDFSILDKP